MTEQKLGCVSILSLLRSFENWVAYYQGLRYVSRPACVLSALRAFLQNAFNHTVQIFVW